jgi:hypothetical protein
MACPLPTVAETLIGADGVAAGAGFATTVLDDPLVPAAFVANTVYAYFEPLVTEVSVYPSPVTVLLSIMVESIVLVLVRVGVGEKLGILSMTVWRWTV